MDIAVIVAAHKPYPMPKDGIYLPIHAGGKGKESIGFRKDDSGDNISEKNPKFCELTALYWAWKNLECGYIGLAHYRRHFAVKINPRDKQGSILDRSQLEPLLEEYDAVLPKPRNYFIETIYSHYSHSHDGAHLRMTREIIQEKYPEYLDSFDRVMRSSKAHMFNMFIMKKELADSYCEWLFDILFMLEKRTDTSGMSAFDARLFGRVGEMLLDVWLMKNRIKYTEVKILYTEKVNMGKKVTGFLKAKFLGVKYKQSF